MNYRDLEPGEQIREGDEYLTPAGEWKATGCDDDEYLPDKGDGTWSHRPHRRPVSLETPKSPDLVNEPPHYRKHPSGVECIQITEGMNFCLGNAVKYIWRADLKGEAIQDLEKAKWYLDREIERRKKRTEVKP